MKTPQWIGGPQAWHAFTYTVDAGRTLAALGRTESAHGQVWHAFARSPHVLGVREGLFAATQNLPLSFFH